MEVGRVEVKKKRARYSEENVEIRAWILQQRCYKKHDVKVQNEF